MRNVLSAMLGLALLGSGLGAAYGHPGHEGHDGAQTTLKGELVDMACYMAHGGGGPKHAKCAKSCVLDGSPVGFVASDGVVYLVVEDHDNKQPYKQAVELAGEQAELTGKVVKRGGLSALIVSKAAKAK